MIQWKVDEEKADGVWATNVHQMQKKGGSQLAPGVDVLTQMKYNKRYYIFSFMILFWVVYAPIFLTVTLTTVAKPKGVGVF